MQNMSTPPPSTQPRRSALYRLFMSLKHASGGFRMHDDGEVDARGTYTVIAVASLLNMLTPELSEGVADFAVSFFIFLFFRSLVGWGG